ncbi:MAG: hypothetical protein K2L80_07950, partial [Muribaculaceae bacterium]|nr:hypothetical protein [Muribaculaceae bacterium]
FTEIGDLGLQLKGYQGAVCDPASGKTYWAASAEAGSGVYEIDLDNASTILLAEFPNGEQFTGLYLKADSPVQTEIPSAAENLTLDFDAEPLKGRVSFDVPALSESGKPLDGLVGYTVSFGDNEIASGAVPAGTKVTTDEINVDKSGEYLVKVVLSNAAGKSVAAYKRKYIGYAVPGVADEVILSAVGGKMQLDWQAPDKAETEGHFSIADLRYEIVRYPHQQTVAAKLDATTLIDDVDTEELCSYRYGVTVCNGDVRSAEAVSNSLIAGQAVSVPYHEDFRRTDALDLYTIEDCNNDGCKWAMNGWSPVLEYFASTCDQDADDWVITPAVRMFKDKVYRLNISAVGDSRLYTQNFDVAMGDAAVSTAMTTRLIEKTEVTSEGCDRSASFTVESDGFYFFGIHTGTEARHGWMNITDLLIEEIGSVKAPAAASIEAVAGEKGALASHVSLVAPTATYEGKPLAAIERMELRRDKAVLKTWSDVAPGATLNFDDNDVPEGLHFYEAVAYSGQGPGYPAEAMVYVGIDAPGAVENVTLVEKDGNAVLSWSPAATGVHGGYVDVDQMYYTVQRNDGEVIADNIRATTCSDMFADYGEQYDLAYAIVAKNSRGAGILTVSPKIIVGPDYELPFVESFASGVPSYYWGLESNDFAYFSLNDRLGLDGDNGSVVFVCNGVDGESSVYTGKISFEGAENPVLEADMYLDSGNFIMEIDVLADGRRDNVAAYNVPLDSRIVRIHLPLAAYAGKRGVQLWFRGKSTMANTVLVLDNIRVVNDKDSGISGNAVAAEVMIEAVDGGVRVIGASGREVAVYRLDGTIAAMQPAADDIVIALPAGAYIVRAGECSAKVLVK